MISGYKKYIEDDNNYINKFGKITHICPECGSVYTQGINLSINCNIFTNCNSEIDSYTIGSPSISKTCTKCNSGCIQIDNSMSNIVKTLIDKKYKLAACCEGHIYNRNDIIQYQFPKLFIYGDIKALIPISYHKTFDIDCYRYYGVTTIDCINPYDYIFGTESFNDYKVEMLETLENLVKSLPNCPFEYDDKYKYTYEYDTIKYI